MCAFGSAELLEERQVKPVEPGAARLERPTAERGIIGLPDGRSRRRLRKRCGIDPLVHVVRTRGDALTRQESGTAISRSGRVWTSNGKRIPILQSQNQIGFPATDDLIHDAVTLSKKGFTGSEGELVSATDVNYMRNVESTWRVVALHPEAWKVGRTEARIRRTDKIVLGISEAF